MVIGASYTIISLISKMPTNSHKAKLFISNKLKKAVYFYLCTYCMTIVDWNVHQMHCENFQIKYVMIHLGIELM